GGGGGKRGAGGTGRADEAGAGRCRSPRARGADAGRLLVGRQERRHRADSDRRGDQEDAGARSPRADRAEEMTRLCDKPRRARRTQSFVLVLMVSAIAAFSAVEAHAQMSSAPASAGYKLEPGMASSQVPAPLREIGFDQNLDQRVPLDVAFRDERGASVRLGDYFGKRPVVMVFAYYDCPMLCTQVINGLSSALGVLSLKPGEDFEIVTVSFNPADTPATARAKKAIYLERYTREGAAASWHFLVGDQPS